MPATEKKISFKKFIQHFPDTEQKVLISLYTHIVGKKVIPYKFKDSNFVIPILCTQAFSMSVEFENVLIENGRHPKEVLMLGLQGDVLEGGRYILRFLNGQTEEGQPPRENAFSFDRVRARVKLWDYQIHQLKFENDMERLPWLLVNDTLAAMEEKAACQQYLAGIANLILGMTMYYSQNYEFDNKATEQISKAKVFIRENLLKGIGPEEVADSLHMSYSWFRKLFKEYTGLSPAHYIQELKIQQAKDLLATTQRSTKEIAYYLTFDDIPYFTKVFKKYTGYTPQSYRKKFGRE